MDGLYKHTLFYIFMCIYISPSWGLYFDVDLDLPSWGFLFIIDIDMDLVLVGHINNNVRYCLVGIITCVWDNVIPECDSHGIDFIVWVMIKKLCIVLFSFCVNVSTKFQRFSSKLGSFWGEKIFIFSFFLFLIFNLV